jgi:hypothetical protein
MEVLAMVRNQAHRSTVRVLGRGSIPSTMARSQSIHEFKKMNLPPAGRSNIGDRKRRGG